MVILYSDLVLKIKMNKYWIGFILLATLSLHVIATSSDDLKVSIS